MLRTCSAVLVLLALAGCGSPRGYPSLAPRAIERLENGEAAAAPAATLPTSPPAAADPALAGRLQEIQARAEAGRSAFDAELAAARTTASAPQAREAGSEAWVAAQQALSRADSKRGEVGGALADLDALRAELVQAGRTDAAVDSVWSRVLAIAAAQDAAYQALAATLPTS